MRFSKRSGVSARLKQQPWRAMGGRIVHLTPSALAAIGLAMLLMVGPRLPNVERILSIFALSAAGVAMMRLHVKELPMEGWRAPKAGLLLWIAAALGIGGVQLGRALLQTRAMDPTLGFVTAAPIVAAALVVGALVSATAASSFSTLLTLGCAVAGVCDLRFGVAAWLAGVVGAHAVNPLKHRSDLFKCGEIVLLTYAAAALAIGGIDSLHWYVAAQAAGWAVIASVGAMALFWLAVAALERVFNLVTDWGLLELCSPEHPLLRELCTVAPGTYHHSIVVANLAESAAQVIGANPLLARVCGYYHDIGKLKRPDFFIENQGMANVHDKLSPSLSAMIIAAHVKDGIDLAVEYRLPQPVMDAIAQHHGTSLITYFYYQAVAGADVHDPVMEQHFRYAGPKPQTKEAAIIMLADTIEAATRTLDRTSPSRLDHMITQLVESRLADGQLEESDVTFGDLRRIVDAFIQTLTASRHQRVDYPEVPSYEPSPQERDRYLESVGTTGEVSANR